MVDVVLSGDAVCCGAGVIRNEKESRPSQGLALFHFGIVSFFFVFGFPVRLEKR